MLKKLTKEKKKQTTLKNFGVEHHWSLPKIRNEIHNKMKINGSYSGVSKSQKKFREIFER